MDKIVLFEFYSLNGYLSVLLSFVISVYAILMQTNRYLMIVIFTLFLLAAVYEYRKYITAIKAYHRVEDELKIELNGYFSETVQGQAVIRAFEKGDSREVEVGRIDHRYGKIYNTVNGMDTTIRFILGLSSTIFISAILIYYFYVDTFS